MIKTENNFERAMLWKNKQKANRQKNIIKKPAVIEAVLQLDHCCDFLDSEFIKTIKGYYELMAAIYEVGKQPLPQNKNVTSDKYEDKVLRELDCPVIEFMHSEFQRNVKKDIQSQGYSDYNVFDSVRGLFCRRWPCL